MTSLGHVSVKRKITMMTILMLTTTARIQQHRKVWIPSVETNRVLGHLHDRDLSRYVPSAFESLCNPATVPAKNSKEDWGRDKTKLHAKSSNAVQFWQSSQQVPVTFDEFYLYMMGECYLKIMEMAHVHRIINIYEKTLWVVCSVFVTLKAQNRWLKTRDKIFSESALMLSFRYWYL